jgi:hypothetical protein
VLKEAFIESFREFDGQTSIQSYELWDLYQRQRRQTTSSMPIDSYLFEKVRPFYDKEYLEFTLMLPTWLRFGQALYKSMIYAIGPEIRGIPNANDQLRLHKSVAANGSAKIWQWMQRGLSQSARALLHSRSKEAQNPTIAKLGVQLLHDNSFRSSMAAFVSSSDFDDSIFNKEGISGLLEEHYNNVKDHSMLLGYVGTFAYGLPYFLSQTKTCPTEAEPLRKEQ